MPYIICLFLSIVALVSSVVSFRLRSRDKINSGWMPAIYILFAGVGLSLFFLFLPVYYFHFFADDIVRMPKTVLISLHNVIRVFVCDGEFDIIHDALDGQLPWMNTLYILVAEILYVIAPVLTASFVLSFFMNNAAHYKFWRNRNASLFILSELNVKSLVLAQSINANEDACNNQYLIIFTDVGKSIEENHNELVRDAKLLNSVILGEDVVDINIEGHKSSAIVRFFLIKAAEDDNVEDYLRLVNSYGQRKDTEIYVFSDNIESEYIVDSTYNDLLRKTPHLRKVRRINTARYMLYSMLYNGKISLFSSAHAVMRDEVKQVSIMILGLQGLGLEFFKAAIWCGQMDGYRLNINAFDSMDAPESRMRARYPELIEKNRSTELGDAHYDLKFFGGNFGDFQRQEFYDKARSLNDTTCVFVCLGDDEKNIEAAIRIRIMFEQIHIHPTIYAVVYHPLKSEMLKRSPLINYSGDLLDIDPVCSIKDYYSYETILNSELETDSLRIHLRWASGNSFDQSEYYRYSSMSSAIHQRMRLELGIPLTSDSDALEHKRWNAYMRTEGYIYSGSSEKASRNNIGRMHNTLVPFQNLSDEEKLKDSRIIGRISGNNPLET